MAQLPITLALEYCEPGKTDPDEKIGPSKSGHEESVRWEIPA